jgi:hypothetical protein
VILYFGNYFGLVLRSGQTPVLDPAEARQLLESIDVSTPAGLCDRALNWDANFPEVTLCDGCV